MWWWQTSTGDPEQMYRHPCPCLPQDSSSAPLHKCPRSIPSSGMTGSTLPWHGPWIPHSSWENLTLPPHRAELIRGKHGIEIVSDYDQGNGNIRFPVVLGEPRTVTVLVQNCGAEVVTLQRFQPCKQSRELSFTDEQGAMQGQSLLLHPGRVPSSHPIPALQRGCRTQSHLFTPQVACTPSRCGASPPAMGTSVLCCSSSSPRSQTSPSASHAMLLPLPRASWPRTWGPRHLSSLTRPASSALSQSSPRMASPLPGMW